MKGLWNWQGRLLTFELNENWACMEHGGIAAQIFIRASALPHYPSSYVLRKKRTHESFAGCSRMQRSFHRSSTFSFKLMNHQFLSHPSILLKAASLILRFLVKSSSWSMVTHKNPTQNIMTCFWGWLSQMTKKPVVNGWALPSVQVNRWNFRAPAFFCKKELKR